MLTQCSDRLGRRVNDERIGNQKYTYPPSPLPLAHHHTKHSCHPLNLIEKRVRRVVQP